MRGSIPSPGPDTAIYGGNTACVEIGCAGRTLIIDAGSGIRALGQALIDRAETSVDVLFSHCHFDHIEGLPFFTPVYTEGNEIRFWSGHRPGAGATRWMIEEFLRPPFFPVSPASFRAVVTYRDFRAGDLLDLGDGISASTALLNHPGGAIGYRVRYGAKSACYISDVEHRGGGPDPALVQFIAGADVVIYDSMYTDEEYACYRGFGHSTWQEAVKLADAAAVNRLLLYHHFPGRSDEMLAEIENSVARLRKNTLFAREGMEIAA
ncbi:MAG: MBL fold metallo-hydrolase [Pseudomonadota bacterium]|nr:MBL fold metallo-hydrolase [Pseudomonadota bacterium]